MIREQIQLDGLQTAFRLIGTKNHAPELAEALTLLADALNSSDDSEELMHDLRMAAAHFIYIRRHLRRGGNPDQEAF